MVRGGLLHDEPDAMNEECVSQEVSANVIEDVVIGNATDGEMVDAEAQCGDEFVRMISDVRRGLAAMAKE